MDDCETILGIVLKLLAAGHTLQQPQQIAPDYEPLQDALIRDFNEWQDADALSVDAVCEALEFEQDTVEAVVEARFIPQRDVDNLSNFLLVTRDSYQAQVWWWQCSLWRPSA